MFLQLVSRTGDVLRFLRQFAHMALINYINFLHLSRQLTHFGCMCKKVVFKLVIYFTFYFLEIHV